MKAVSAHTAISRQVQSLRDAPTSPEVFRKPCAGEYHPASGKQLTPRGVSGVLASDRSLVRFTTCLVHLGGVHSYAMIKIVELTRQARRDLRSVPRHVATKLLYWVSEVESIGLEETRKYPGFHDEPLKGKRKGQRSIRLSRAYRAIYVTRRDATIEFVSVKEVTKHGY